LFRAGFAACGIIPFNPARVLGKLPPEESTRQNVQGDFNQQLVEELKRNGIYIVFRHTGTVPYYGNVLRYRTLLKV
jgi:hypothetical protein